MSAIADEMSEFKHCTVCGKRWVELLDFVLDRTLRVDGYQACITQPEEGLIYVTHCRAACGTTLGIAVGALKPLYDGPRYAERYTGEERCREFCLNRNTLEECDVDCELAWARTALQWLRRHELPPHLK